MAKGMLPDEHFLCVGSARTRLHRDILISILCFVAVFVKRSVEDFANFGQFLHFLFFICCPHYILLKAA